LAHISFHIRNEEFFTRSRKSRAFAEASLEHAAQEIPLIDDACPAVALAKTEDCEKGPFLEGN
jgi:hypothetical protein